MTETFTQQLSRYTAKIKRARPALKWSEARSEARAYLNGIKQVYPSVPAIMRKFRWQELLKLKTPEVEP